MCSGTIRTVAWSEGTWTHDPASSFVEGTDLVVTAMEGSDAWRHTSYGFVHESEHALVAPFGDNTAIEVTFMGGFEQQFDQAGVFLFVDELRWIKAGVEFVDGQLQLGAVVTDGRSDWSVAPVPDWLGRRVTIRASRARGAVTIRARVDQEPFRMVRVAPITPEIVIKAGPLCCAPTRSGLEVRFLSWVLTPADQTLH
jgi:regulation of enolase protein 1 (concanavalin A-like superfamily)